MYSAYPVDDEELILDEYIRTIPWMDNGFEIVGHNTSPHKAVEEIEIVFATIIFSLQRAHFYTSPGDVVRLA